ncbi:MAG: sigma-70 family RNA polymerase sigma factor [Isosphaeraceae bacterium]
MAHQAIEGSGPLPPANPRPLAQAQDLVAERMAEAMEACRQYLLLVAGEWMGQHLTAKAGASDIVQDTFLEAHRELPRFRGRSEAELRAWLREILHNNLVNFTRRYGTAKRDVRREVALNPVGTESHLYLTQLVSDSLTPFHSAIRREQLEALAAAIRNLSDRDRQLIVWHHQEHRSFQEIGDLLGLQPDTIRVAWARAIKRLQKLIAATSDASTRVDPAPPEPPHERAAR